MLLSVFWPPKELRCSLREQEEEESWLGAGERLALEWDLPGCCPCIGTHKTG